MANELPEYFDNIVLGQYAMTGVPLKVFANDRYYIIPSPDDVDDPLIGYGMTPSGKMEPFDYRDIEHIMVSGNKVDLAAYTKAMGDELKGVKKASDAKGGEEKKEEGGEEEKPAAEEEGGEAPKSPFESFDPFAKKWSLKALYEISKDEYNAQEDALKAEMEAGKAKIDAAKEKLGNLKKQPIDDGVINEIGFGDQDLQAIHFETDPEKQKKLKLAYGAKFGGITSREKIENADYELKRFRKQIKFGDGTYLGVFIPGSYDAITSDLGDGPHARKQRKPQSWNQRSYNKWIKDMASGGGADHAYDMAQNAKLEPGLLQWVKRNLVNGETPLERIQYDIEALAESSFSTKPMVESVISDILIIASESTTYEKFISELISQKLLKREDLKDSDLVDELKTMYRGQALGKRESVNEYRELSPKMVNNFKIGDTIKTQKGTYTITGFGRRANAFREFEAENEKGKPFNLRISLRGATGISAAAGAYNLNFPEQEEMLESILESAYGDINERMGPGDYEIRPALKKLKTGLKDDDVVFTIDDEKLDQMVNSRFSSQLNFQEVNGDSYYILNQKYFDRLIDLADSSGFDVDYENSEDSVLFIYENVNENHISEPYIFQVGDIVRNVNPQCNHYGSTGIVNAIQALDGDMGNIVKYIVTNFGDTFKPGMALMKTPDQLELMDDINESGSINEYGATPSKKNWLGWFVLNANLHGDLNAWKKGELIKAYKSDEKGYVFIYTGDYDYEAYDDISQSDFNRIATSLDPTKHKKSYNYVKKLEKLNRLKDYEVIN